MVTSKRMVRVVVAAAALAVSSGADAGEPSVVVAPGGDVHWVKVDGGAAVYGYCAEGCARADEVTVRFELGAPVQRAAVALGADGEPRLLLETPRRIHYAVCDGDCTRRSGWSATVALDHGGRHALAEETFGVDAAGVIRFHIVPRTAAAAQEPAFVVTCTGKCESMHRWDAHLALGRDAVARR